MLYTVLFSDAKNFALLAPFFLREDQSPKPVFFRVHECVLNSVSNLCIHVFFFSCGTLAYTLIFTDHNFTFRVITLVGICHSLVLYPAPWPVTRTSNQAGISLVVVIVVHASSSWFAFLGKCTDFFLMFNGNTLVTVRGNCSKNKQCYLHV